MNPLLDNNEFELFRAYIETNSGIHLDQTKSYLIQNRLESIMAEYGCTTFLSLYQKTIADPTRTIQEKIIEAITTNETLWFRDISPFNILQNKLFPFFTQQVLQGNKNKIRIWSSACSTGQEPYSIAITFLEFIRGKVNLQPELLEIVATDISPKVLQQAQNGTYDAIAMGRGLSDELKNRYFNNNIKTWTIKDEVKRMISFKKLNLQNDFRTIGNMDIIFCRNVLIYFSDNFKREILSRIAQMLQPSGILFVGASESVSNYSSDFDMISFDKGLYYQVKNKKLF